LRQDACREAAVWNAIRGGQHRERGWYTAPARTHPKETGSREHTHVTGMGFAPIGGKGTMTRGARSTDSGDAARVMRIMSEWYEMQLPEIEKWRGDTMQKLYEAGRQFVPNHTI